MTTYKETGGPAFPGPAGCGADTGMTLRDYFAAKAMQGWLTTFGAEVRCWEVRTEIVAGFAYLMADAMLKVRKGK